jgi:cytoskeletal protein CcmA (bactofilin family)
MANGNFILPASTQIASSNKPGVVKIGTGINVNSTTGVISTDLTTIGGAAKLNTLMDVDANGAAAGGSVIIKRTTGSSVITMQKYISIWVATYKKGNNDSLLASAYQTFINGTGNDPIVAVAPGTINDINGNPFTSADYTALGITIGTAIPQFRNKYPDGLRNIFQVQDTLGANLFAVKANGDANIAGIIEINGTGLSKFNGDVQVGGNLTVLGNATVKGIMSGDTFEITGDLKVDGNTFLGDNAAIDKTTIKGYTSIQHQYNKITVETAVNAAIATWKTAHPTFTMSELNAYRIGPKGAAGTSLESDVISYIDALAVIDSTGKPIFQVKSNGDTTVGGVLSVNGSGESYFQGDVNINGSLTVEKNATVKGAFNGDVFTISGSTILGDGIPRSGAIYDTTTINGATTVRSDVNKVIGVSTTNVFQVVAKDDAKLFEVRQNGDAVIAGNITVNSTGSTFAGNTTFQGSVDIGGSLTVDGSISGASLDLGTDAIITGNLVVNGNTTLGDDAAVDVVNINGVTTVKSAVTKAVGSTVNPAFKVVDSANAMLFQVSTNGDVKVAANLNVTGGATVTADMTGQNMTVNGNLIVRGNTTLGDGTGSDTFIFGTGTTVNLGGNKLTNAADPVNPQDVATKAYVDNVVTGLDVKKSVKVGTVGNITTLGLQTIDGVTLADGDRVLVKDQTDKTKNGIYVAQTGAWLRSTDADNGPTIGSEVTPGMFTFIEQGTKNANTGWILITTAGVTSITLDTSQINFSQFAGAGSMTAVGEGLTQNGTQFTLQPATYTTLGGIIVEQDNFNVNSGLLSLKPATSANLGGIKSTTSLTNGVTIDASGILTTQQASTTQYGSVKVGNGITVSSGVISVGNVTGGDGTANLSNVSKTDVANSIAQRTADGSLVAHDLELTGKVTKVNGLSTGGNYGVQTMVASASGLVDVLASQTTITSFTNGASGGNFLVYLYFKVTAGTTLDLIVDYNDGDAQSQIISAVSNGTQTIGAYSVAPLYLYVAANQIISVKATAGAINSIKANASIAAL